MKISAPFDIKVVHKEDEGRRELHLQFTQTFRSMPVDHRSVVFKKYVVDLNSALLEIDDDNEAKAGLMTLHQISSELLAPIMRDEIPMSETIVIELAKDANISGLWTDETAE